MKKILTAIGITVLGLCLIAIIIFGLGMAILHIPIYTFGFFVLLFFCLIVRVVYYKIYN